MAYPLIILGAGASYDYIDREANLQGPFHQPNLMQYRPPLMSDLFNQSYFHDFLQMYPSVSALAADAINAQNLESYLTEVQEVKALINPDRYNQLIEIRFYLSKLFLHISKVYFRPANYYKKLLTMIGDTGGRACFVNFNYDLLLEKNIPQISGSNNVDSYVSSSLKLIKIHGACDWFYRDDFIQGEDIVGGHGHFLNRSQKYINYLKDDNLDKKIIIKKLDENWNFIDNEGGNIFCYLPALAIPITVKSNYVCPKSHIDILEESLKEIDRILIIGWRGNDQFLIDLLKEKIKKPTPLIIVSRSGTANFRGKLDANKNIKVSIGADTFTEFIKKGRCDNFFK